MESTQAALRITLTESIVTGIDAAIDARFLAPLQQSIITTIEPSRRRTADTAKEYSNGCIRPSAHFAGFKLESVGKECRDLSGSIEEADVCHQMHSRQKPRAFALARQCALLKWV
ncbi:hypothetical protein BJ741DRAFT_706109 [Chytriomyces cf. hyalinus JEL632]|nr:hypothetical protein BJ741DRAFT_706109 [Chytriomyces cf. hyalinus JEL632]